MRLVVAAVALTLLTAAAPQVDAPPPELVAHCNEQAAAMEQGPAREAFLADCMAGGPTGPAVPGLEGETGSLAECLALAEARNIPGSETRAFLERCLAQ